MCLADSLRSIRHRGPDASGIWSGNVGRRFIALGHVRLSILDLASSADQPLQVNGGNAVIAFNGEIYNYLALRDRLRSDGEYFDTRSDTEVLLRAYVRYGRECLKELRGMFAFVIVDKVRQKLLVARDGMGIKPLYVFEDARSGQYAFASEIRALEALLKRRLPVDRSALSEFLLNGFLYEPRTGIEGIGKVPPGSALEIDLRSGAISRFRFSCAGSPGRALETLVTDEIALEVEADVPVGVFFSGGVDSSVVAAFSAKKSLEAIFVDYSEDHEHADRGYARRVASDLGLAYREISHVVHTQSNEEIIDDFRAVAAGTEEPISDYTFSATKQISRIAREAGFRVMLSGMGGDELFAGYPRHALARRWSTLRWLGAGAAGISTMLKHRPGWSRRADRLSGFLRAGDFGRAYTSLVGYFSYGDVERLLGSKSDLEGFDLRLQEILAPVAHESDLKKAMHLDRYGYLSHNLTVTDKASMSESLEVRVPLLTEEIAAYGWALDDGELIRGMSGKEPLKRLLRKRLGDHLVNRPKQAFNPPLDGRLRRLGPDALREFLLNGSLRGVMDTSILRRLIDDHFRRTADNTYKLWQLLYLAFWVEQRPLSLK